MAKEEPYYIHRYSNPSFASWWFVVPIETLGIKKPADVTALHLAEHTAFGTIAQQEIIGRDSFSVGGLLIKGTLTKQAVFFDMPFFPARATAAKTVWKSFLGSITATLSDTDWSSSIKELEDELDDLSFISRVSGQLRRRLFPLGSINALSSGGQRSHVSQVNRETNQQLRTLIKKTGSNWLFWPQDQPLPSFVKQPEGTFPIRPPYQLIKIKNQSAICRQGSGVVMPPLCSDDLERMLGILDLALSQLGVWETTELSVLSYHEITTIFFIGSGVSQIRQDVAGWLKTAPRALLKEFSEGCLLERKVDITTGPRLVIEDWLRGFLPARPLDWLVKELIKACSISNL